MYYTFIGSSNGARAFNLKGVIMNAAKLQKDLNNQITLLGGNEAAFAVCDKVYNETFRLDPIDFGNSSACKRELKFDMANKLYMKEFGYQDYDECLEWFENEYPNFKIEDNTLIVELCNYKGECDRQEYGLFELYKHCAIFKD